MTLFPDNTPPAKSSAKALSLILQFDGGSRGNPGPAGIGVTVVTADDETPLYELGDFIGNCTNNVAEYTALIRGLEAAVVLGATQLLIRADSELVVRQLNGQYKVKSPDLKPLYLRAIKMVQQIGSVKVTHVYREKNSRADALANEAMDAKRKLEPLGPLSAWINATKQNKK